MKAQEVWQEERIISLKRHQSQCRLCSHPQREEIEEAWVNWGRTTLLADRYGLSRDGIYRHMHALGLDRKREKNRKGFYGGILERRDTVSFSGSNLLAAFKDYASLCEREEEQQQEKKGLLVRELFQRMSKQEREAFAEDGSLPEWFLAEATPEDSAHGEGEIPADGTQLGSQGATPENPPHGEPAMPADAAQGDSEGATPLGSQDEQNPQLTTLQ